MYPDYISSDIDKAVVEEVVVTKTKMIGMKILNDVVDDTNPADIICSSCNNLTMLIVCILGYALF